MSLLISANWSVLHQPRVVIWIMGGICLMDVIVPATSSIGFEKILQSMQIIDAGVYFASLVHTRIEP